MNILSIDFDYFQKVSKRTIENYYPDSVDVPIFVSTVTWGNRYADPKQKEKLQKIKIKRKELNFAKKILRNQSPDCPILIANSHKHIYDFVHNLTTTNEPLTVINVDMHDDFYNGNPDVDCGNWLGFLADEYEEFCCVWALNPISLSICNADTSVFNHLASSLEEFLNDDFDAIFICRSDNWSPPHLDEYFSELCDTAAKHFDRVKAEQGITVPRDMSEIDEMAEQLKRFYVR